MRQLYTSGCPKCSPLVSPLRIAVMLKSSTKPDVHIVLHCSQKDWVTATCNMQSYFGEVSSCSSYDMWVYRKTEKTNTIIIILCTPSINNVDYQLTSFKTFTPSCIGCGSPANDRVSFFTWNPTNLARVCSRNKSRSFWLQTNTCTNQIFIFHTLWEAIWWLLQIIYWKMKYNYCSQMVWACAAKRRQWLGKEMYGVWSGGYQAKRWTKENLERDCGKRL